MSLGFSDFDTSSNKNDVIMQVNRMLIEEFVKANDLIKLKCDDLGMSVFYWDTNKNVMYETQILNEREPIKISNNLRILRYNGEITGY